MLLKSLFIMAFWVLLTGCPKLTKSSDGSERGRDVVFVGVDISGSFMNKWVFKDSLEFMAHYLYAHLQGIDGLDKPGHLFVGSIGGTKSGEPKTFYPIQTFEYRSIKQIHSKLKEIFPKNVKNPFTDFNAFFEQVSVFVKNKKLVLRPVTIILLTDGIPDAPKVEGKYDYRSINVNILENLARVTLRVLYTDATVAMNWQTEVPRQRVKIWTQDAQVMKSWKDPVILQPKKKFEERERFFSWIKDNVDFNVPRRRVD